LNHAAEGYSNVGNDSPLVLAGDRVWIGGGWVGNKPTYTLEAYPADTDQLMKEKAPLVSVPLVDSYRGVKILYAGNSLWLLWTRGDKPGFLYQLDPQTGATLNSLDLVEAQDWAKGDVPIDIDVPSTLPQRVIICGS
jgi:Na+-transporting NADH:ubiquinone oxidoreductase subunit NqrB